MVSAVIAHIIFTLIYAAIWHFTKDFKFMCLGAIFYSVMIHGWAKVWVRANEKWLESNKIWFERGFYTLLITTLVYVAGLIFTQTESILFLKPVVIFVLLVVAVSSLFSYIGVAHRLYSATYSGRRAVADAVFMASFPRTFYLCLAYATTIGLYLQAFELFWG